MKKINRNVSSCLLTLFWVIFAIFIDSGVCQNNTKPSDTNAEKCKLNNGLEGICKNISYCPAALSNLRSGLRDIVKCPGTNPKIICCPTEQRRSAKMCMKYLEVLKAPIAPIAVPLLPPGFIEEEEPTEEVQCTLNLNPLISAGRPATVGEFPHLVAIGYNVARTPWRCGGTLISDQWVLTAGHCVNNANSGNPVRVLAGDITLSRKSSDARVMIDIQEIRVHPDYKPPKTYNDLALIKLKHKVKFSRSLLPACLAQPEDDFLKGIDNRTVNVGGWGVTGTGGKTQFYWKTGFATFEAQSDTLQVAGLTGLNLKSCNAFYSDVPSKEFNFPEGIIRSQICASDRVGRKDTCKGDSGSPLWVTKSERCVYYLLGLTSFGPNNCGERAPGIYTNVYSYLDWIEDNVWPVPKNGPEN